MKRLLGIAPLVVVLALAGCSSTQTLDEIAETCGGDQVGLFMSESDSLIYLDGFEGGEEGIKCVFGKVVDSSTSGKLSSMFEAREDLEPTKYGAWEIVMAESDGVYAVAVSRK